LSLKGKIVVVDDADTAFAHWTSLLASLGRVEALAVLLETTRERDFGAGSIRHLMNQTREGYLQMIVDPGSSFRCGSLAVANVARVIGSPEETVVTFLKATG